MSHIIWLSSSQVEHMVYGDISLDYLLLTMKEMQGIEKKISSSTKRERT